MSNYWNTYSFTRPLTSDGKPTYYISILALLDKQPLRKCELLDIVRFGGREIATKNPHFWRGYMSSLFSAMNRKGIARYDAKTHRWFITDRGRDTLEDAKVEWGRRYAEKLWNRDFAQD